MHTMPSRHIPERARRDGLLALSCGLHHNCPWADRVRGLLRWVVPERDRRHMVRSVLGGPVPARAWPVRV
jgi:hypothetical protein